MMTTQLPPLIDIGVNLTNKRLCSDLSQLLQRSAAAGVTDIIITGTSVEESEKALQLCTDTESRVQLFATAGIHPHHASEITADAIDLLRSLCSRDEVVAVGETGLDFNRNFSPPQQQQSAFEQQLQLAAETCLPVFMHERDAHTRQYDILRDFRDKLSDGIIHCFTGSREALYNYLDLDLYIGITGWICDDKRGRALRELVKEIPADRLMVETDAPYLLPKNLPDDHAFQPTGNRNEPALLPWIVREIANHRPESADQLAHLTTNNARQFFRLNASC